MQGVKKWLVQTLLDPRGESARVPENLPQMTPIQKPPTDRFLHQRQLLVICHPVEGDW